MNRVRLAAALAASALVASSTALSAAGAPQKPHGPADSTTTQSTVDASSALVQLRLEPLTTAESTRPPKGKKVDFSSQQVKSYQARLAAEKNAFKRWLRANAPKARVTGQFDLSLNAVAVKLNGTSLATLRKAPQVIRAEYEGLYRPTAEVAVDPDLSLINAMQAWEAVGGDAEAGKGVKVAILDTGIDITNPCFDDDGYGDNNMQPNSPYTNDKVIVAKVFANKAAKYGYDAEAVQDHGTHVAGTVACNADTAATVDGVPIPYGISGVAPAALLGNYNVFPGDIEDARSEDILNALEAAYADGMDIANMSLGGGAHGIQDLLTIAVDNLDEAGMVSAVAAGNSGPGFGTIESPGSAERALTAGASSVPHFVGSSLTFDGTSVGLASGDFEVAETDISAPLGIVAGTTNGLDTACAELATGSLSNRIAVLSRGTCTFSTKIRNAQVAGAVAAIVVNNVAGDPVAMAADGTPDQPTIPAYMASLADVASLVAADGESATILAALSYHATTNANIMAGFSSQGPTPVDRRVKPDVVAPGVNVLSSIPSSFCDGDPCFAFFQGTSMATPHLAGSAAVVKAAHPGWSAAEIRSAIVNTAQRGVLTSYRDGSTAVSDPNIVGAGLEDLEAAVGATALLDPVSTSFGTIPSGSGQTRSAVVHVNNVGASELEAAVTDPGMFTVRGGPIAADGEGDLTVSVSVPKKTAPGPYSATLELTADGTVVAHAVLYVLVG